MAAVTLQELRDYIRTSIDTDDEECPDTLTDSWVREGYRRFIRRGRRWPWFYKEWSLTTTAGVRDYYISSALTAKDVEHIVDVFGTSGSLQFVDHGLAVATWAATETESTSEPTHFSVLGDPSSTTYWKLHLWPKPDAAYTYTVRGYRKPTDWTRLGSGTPADCPDDVSEVLQEWCLYRAYSFLDDPEMAATHKAAFEESAVELTKFYLRTPEPQPVVLNGGRTTTALPTRLRYSFE